jgi:hypothetical protein
MTQKPIGLFFIFSLFILQKKEERARGAMDEERQRMGVKKAAIERVGVKEEEGGSQSYSQDCCCSRLEKSKLREAHRKEIRQLFASSALPPSFSSSSSSVPSLPPTRSFLVFIFELLYLPFSIAGLFDAFCYGFCSW